MTYLILWNNDNYGKYIQNKLNNGSELITRLEEFNTITDFSKYSKIIVQAELEWEGKYYGIEIVKQMRRMDIIQPIYLCSWYTISYYSKSDEPRLQIVKSPGCIYHRIPVDINLIKSDETANLDEFTLEDIKEHLCELRGYVVEILHNLKNKQKTVNANTIITITDDLNKILPVLDENKKNDLDRIIQEMANDVEKNHDLSIYEEKIINLIPTQQENSSTNNNTQPPWKALYIDDEIQWRDEFKNILSKHNINCETVSTAEEAYKILDEDAGTNYYTVLIADYRLLEEDQKWQKEQGYTILKNVYEQKPNLLSLFALTATSRRALMRIQVQYPMKVETYSKQDLKNEQAWNVFIERIRERGEETWDAVCSQPVSTAWNKIKPIYKQFRESQSFNSNNDRIGKEAKYIIKRISVLEKSKNELLILKKHDFNLKNLSADLDKIRRFDDLSEKLIARRVVIMLIIKKWTFNKIYALLSHGYFDISPNSQFIKELIVKNAEKNKKNHNSLSEKELKDIIDKINDNINNSSKALINTKLAVSESDIPYSLLAEEKEWLQKEMKIKIYEEVDNQHVLKAIENAIYKTLNNTKHEKTVKVENLANLEKIINKNQLSELVLKYICENILKFYKPTTDEEKILEKIYNRWINHGR